MNKFIIASAFVVLAAQLALSVPVFPADAGEQLARELGLEDPAEAQRAVDELATGQRLGLVPEGPVDEQALSTARGHLERADQLRQEGKFIEALVEAQRARSLCSKAKCSAQVNANAAIHAIEDELKTKDQFGLLGLASGASQSEVSKARKRLLLLVHPDKLGGADKQTANYLKNLFDKVETAYNALSAQNK